MSTHDGSYSEEAYCSVPSTVGVEMTSQLLAQRMNQAAAQPQTLLMGPPYMSPASQTQQQQHQFQHYNEYYYNLYSSQPGQPETYSVLPVGHGNFLKVYHCQENAANAALANEANALYHGQSPQQAPQSQYQQQAPPSQYQQPQPAFHIHQSQAQPPTPQYFNSYELFSSNTLMPTPDNQPTLNRPDIKTGTLQVTQHTPIFMVNNHEEPICQQGANTASANMIINNLVHNWSPKVTGAPIQQLPMQSQNALNSETYNTAIEQEITSIGSDQIMSNNNPDVVEESIQFSISSTAIQSQSTPVSGTVPETDTMDNEIRCNSKEALTPTSTISVSISPTNLIAPEVKKRIVAEVKPMRMSYSDVLSKVNNQSDATQLHYNYRQSQAGRCGKNITSDRKGGDMKNSMDNSSGNVGLTRRQISFEDETGGRSSKKSPTHENKENLQQFQNGGVSKNTKRINQSSITVSANSISNNISSNNNTQNKVGQKGNQKINISETSVNPTGFNKSNNNINKKRNNHRRNEIESNKIEMNSNKNPKSNSFNGDKDFNGYYNVTAKNNENGERASRPNNNSFGSGSNQSNSSTANIRKSNKSSFYNNSNTSPFNVNQSRTRYANANSNSSYSYSSKRSRNTNSSYNNSSAGSTNRNYELAKKFLYTWLEYTIKILTWLFYLIYDIVVLGCSVAYDRLVHAGECCFLYAQQLRKDFKQNSNKPNIWLKSYWRRFDARFQKNSQWAFWRSFCQKKPPEITKESMKSGRLPQTGEEAMYSLLNCKGKDAYSILGVPPDCSQEQIRKHYKKIAVLVHPDKNKQAGAEEAFKVLQRAFELIGEPEKRLAYDQSLAEALHAEKAWTELHDLLSQLQTKITEAANTIRCSTCGLRHPRRITERPHYAARECASCKIRHSAREGDIWAETSLLGLRWRYLALMEGKVYDITEWANCQKGALSHLEPNSHMVQYRIVRGAQQQQQQQQQPTTNSPNHQTPQQPYSQQPGPHNDRNGSGKFKRNIPTSEASLHEFLDSLYSGQHPNPGNSATYSNASRRRTRRN
ncbi:uncharacterized protein LOC105226098 [Bactrocera dorsalis]|uniref:Uncharacterized protein LOC105226098 n=1 Tax=Bactrocera dorsalis TaxID=27457 RepID=A0A6I9UXY8_BACDO|nr:uncharacterized protein LOC105226098 [Bactrocera dorsalis]